MASKKREFTATEIKAGITVLAGAAVLLLFLAVILGWRPPEAVKTFHSDFRDTAGLNLGGDVRFGGVKAGRVTAVASKPQDQSRMRIIWTVRADVPVNQACVASVSQISIAGDKHLEVSTGSPTASLLADGSAVPVKDSSGGMFDALGDIAADVRRVLSDDGALGDLRKLLGVQKSPGGSPEGMVPLTAVLTNTDSLVTDLRGTVGDSRKDIAAVLKKLQEMEDSAKALLSRVDAVVGDNSEDIRGSISGIRELVGKSRKAVDDLAGQIDKVASGLVHVMENARGMSDDARGLVADNRPYLEDTVRELRELVRNLKKFSRIAAETPNALLLGTTPEGRP